ncbi:MAG: MBL fold metallo-hydrolase [Alphaproteobacteria bacterium]|nr:MBL fold metallo-hydrolase [Alphaproteobacteria bacterium]
MTFNVKFWGVRGSIACASPDHMKYGGNTSCIEVLVNGKRLILDAGTGIRQLGNEMQKSGMSDFHILLTHTHWDHINGFPFFTPAYNKDLSIDIRAGHLNAKGGVKEVLSAQMDNPMFPVPLEAMTARITYTDFKAGEAFDICDDIHVRTAPLNHPNGSTAYRVEHHGKSMVYVTDTEHVPGKPDQNILDLIQDADLVIYDSTYTEEEFPAKIGWGHSTWNEGVRLCRMANVKRMAIFHHEPDHYDDIMDQIAIEARAEWAGAFVCREGMVIDLDNLDAIDGMT